MERDNPNKVNDSLIIKKIKTERKAPKAAALESAKTITQKEATIETQWTANLKKFLNLDLKDLPLLTRSVYIKWIQDDTKITPTIEPKWVAPQEKEASGNSILSD